MKRFLTMLALTAVIAGTSGCSCSGPFNGALGSRLQTFGSNLRGTLPAVIEDGPVRRWLRGDACDQCNVPAGQISHNAAMGANCQTGICNPPVGETVFGAPIAATTAPVSTGYTPTYGDAPLEAPIADLNIGYHSHGVFDDPYSGVEDHVEIPPMGN